MVVVRKGGALMGHASRLKTVRGRACRGAECDCMGLEPGCNPTLFCDESPLLRALHTISEIVCAYPDRSERSSATFTHYLAARSASPSSGKPSSRAISVWSEEAWPLA